MIDNDEGGQSIVWELAGEVDGNSTQTHCIYLQCVLFKHREIFASLTFIATSRNYIGR
jgi:hypothetical protein